MRRTHFHIHVPKAAGWMFWDILKVNFGENLKNAYFPASYEFLSVDAVEWMLRQYRYTCYTSHGIRLSSIPVVFDHEMVANSFVRDPVKKFISYYFYTRNIPETGEWNPVKKLKLGDFLDALLNDPKFSRLPFDISQDEFIRGSQQPCTMEKLVKQEFGDYHLFPTERFDDALICLETLYPEDFRDCSYGERSNKSTKDQEVTNEDLRKVEQLPWIAKDRRLHTFAFEYIDGLLASIFPDEAALSAARQDFSRRCQARLERKSQPQSREPLNRRLRSAARIILKGQ